MLIGQIYRIGWCIFWVHLICNFPKYGHNFSVTKSEDSWYFFKSTNSTFCTHQEYFNRKVTLTWCSWVIFHHHTFFNVQFKCPERDPLTLLIYWNFLVTRKTIHKILLLVLGKTKKSYINDHSSRKKYLHEGRGDSNLPLPRLICIPTVTMNFGLQTQPISKPLNAHEKPFNLMCISPLKSNWNSNNPGNASLTETKWHLPFLPLAAL